MSIAETAKLLASLDMHDGMTPVIKTMTGSLDKLDTRIGKTQSRAYRTGAQIGTGIKSGAVIAGAALTGLAGLLVLSAKEGQGAQNVQLKYAQALKDSGKVSADYVARLNAQQDALLNLSGADDEAIKAAQTQLIQMGLTGAQIEKLTPLALDLSTATGKDLTTATLAVGKAAQGSTKALQQMGIILPKGADAVAELNKRFGGTTAALSGQLDVRLKVLEQRLGNVREAAGVKLLPALTKLVDLVGSKLVPAFGEFIDAILPAALSGLDKLSSYLESGGATTAFTKMLDVARSAAPVLKSAAEATLTVVQTAVNLFSSLPPQLQALAIAGIGLNKLTGGLVTNLAGGLAGEVVSKLIPAVLSKFTGGMNVTAGVVTVNGAIGGPGVPGEPGGGQSKLGKALDLVSKVAIVGAVAEVADIIHEQIKAAPDIPASQLSWPWGPKNTPTILAEIFGRNGLLGGFKAADEQAASLAATLAVLNNTAIGPGINGQPMGPHHKGPAPTDVLRIMGPGENGPIDNLTRQGLRANIRELEKLKPTKDTARAIVCLQNRLQNRIDAEKLRVSQAIDASARAITAAVKAAGDNRPTVIVPVTSTTVVDGRTLTANLTRYVSVTGGMDLARGVIP